MPHKNLHHKDDLQSLHYNPMSEKLTCINLWYSMLWVPASAICSLSVSSSWRAISARSTALKYWPCNSAFKQCCAHNDPSCWKNPNTFELIKSSLKSQSSHRITYQIVLTQTDMTPSRWIKWITVLPSIFL